MTFHSLLVEYLCCCHRRRKRPKEYRDQIPDEEAPFLTAADGDPPILNYGTSSADDQQAKERQNVIVRSKEGRMVNVLARVPFNLRNEPGRASSSRSHRSTSATLDGPSNPHLDPHYHYRGDFLSHRQHGTSRASSPPLSRSESLSSLRHTLSRASTSDELYDRDRDRAPPLASTLKVVLIKTPKSHARALSRRGRSRTRAVAARFGEGGEEGAGALGPAPALEGIQSVDSGRAFFHVGDTSMNTEDDNAASVDGDLTSHPDGAGIEALNEEDDAAIRALSEEISSSLSEDFNFQDVGSIARGWGD